MTPLRFKIRHAFRNIQSKKGSSAIVILTLSILITLILLSLSMFSVMKQVFTYQAEEIYQSADVILSYDENSQVRIINKRNLELNYSNELTSASVFFNIYTLFGEAEDQFYAQLMSSAPYELERLIDQDLPSMGERSMVITRSLSEERKIVVGDNITFYINDQMISYEVVGIANDSGVFSGSKVFVLKNALMNDLLGVSNLDNLGNTIYVNLKAHVSSEQFIEILKSDPDYQDYQITETKDMKEITRLATYNSSMFLGIAVLMLVAIVLVLHSLFILFFKDYTIESGVVSSLGGNSKYTFHVWSIEIVLFLIASTFIAWVLNYLIINLGALFFGIHHFIVFPVYFVPIALAACGLFLWVEMNILHHRQQKFSSVQRSTSFRYGKVLKRYWLGLFAALLFLLFSFVHPFSIGIEAFIQLVLSIIILFHLFELMIAVIYKWMKKRNKPTLFSRISIRQMKDNPYFHHSFKVLFVIFLVSISVISVRTFIDEEFEAFYDQLQVDYAVTGIFDYQDSIKQEMITSLDVTNVDEGIVYQNSLMHFDEMIKRTRFNVSMDYQAFLEHFAFETADDIDFSISGNTPAIIIPLSLKYIYEVEVGDVISMDMSRDIVGIPFVIVGFFETNFDNIVYTNIYEYSNYEDILSTNTIFVQTENEAVYQDLIHAYSLDMYYILSMKEVVKEYNNYILSINELFAFLSSVLLGCFVVVMINNILLIFYSMKPDYAKMIVLGQEPSGFGKMLFKEVCVLFGILILLCIAETFVFTKYFPRVMLVFHYYKNIIPTPWVLIQAFLLEGAVLAGTYSFYLYKITKMNVIEETKKY